MEETRQYFIYTWPGQLPRNLNITGKKKKKSAEPLTLTCEPLLGRLGHQIALQWEVVTNEGSHPG